MDFGGLAQGLSAQVPYDQLINNIRYNQQEREQARARAEQRAKMFADDTQYNNAMNAYDHDIVKNFSEQKVRDLGKWATENPTWRIDPMLRAEYQRKTNELKDNPYLQTGMAVDKSINDYRSFINDPKNADVLDLPETQQYKTHLDNYLKTGSIDGVAGNRQLFQFKPVVEEDLTPIYKMYGENADHAYAGSKGLGLGVNQARYTVTTDNLKKEAEAIKNHAVYGRKTMRDFKVYKDKNPESKLNYDQYLLNQISPFAKEDKYDMYNYHVNDSNGGGKGSKAPASNLYEDLVKNAIQGNGKPVQAVPDGLENMLVGKNGTLNLNNSYMLSTDKDGNMRDNIPFNGGLTKDYSFSGATVRTIKNTNGQPQLVATFKAQVPVDKFDDLVGKDVLDTPDWWFSNTTDVRSKYKGLPIQIVKNDKGEDVVEFEVSKPLPYNQNSAYGYNWGAHSKQQEFSSETGGQQPPQTVTQNGVEYHYNQATGKYE